MESVDIKTIYAIISIVCFFFTCIAIIFTARYTIKAANMANNAEAWHKANMANEEAEVQYHVRRDTI